MSGSLLSTKNLKCQIHYEKAQLVCTDLKCSCLLCQYCMNTHDLLHRQNILSVDELLGSSNQQSVLIEQINKLLIEEDSSNYGIQSHIQDATDKIERIFQDIYQQIQKKLEIKKYQILQKLKTNNFKLHDSVLTTELNSLKSQIKRQLTLPATEHLINDLIKKYQRLFYYLTPKINENNNNVTYVDNNKLLKVISPLNLEKSINQFIAPLISELDNIIEYSNAQSLIQKRIILSETSKNNNDNISNNKDNLNNNIYNNIYSNGNNNAILQNGNQLIGKKQTQNKTAKKVSFTGDLKLDLQLVSQMNIHSKPILYLNHNEKDKQLISSGADSQLNVLDNKIERIIMNIPVIGLIWSIVQLTDTTDTQALAGSEGKITVLRNLSQLVIEVKAHDCDIYCLLYIQTYKWIVSGSKDHLIKIWNIQTGQLVKILSGNTEAVISLVEIKKKEQIVSGSDSGIIRIWNLKNMLCIKTLYTHKGTIRSLLYIDDSDQLISGGSDNKIIVTHLSNMSLNNQSLTGHEFPITGLIYCKRESMILSASRDGVIRLWNSTNLESKGYQRTPNGITCIALINQSKNIVTGDDKGYLTLYKYSD